MTDITPTSENILYEDHKYHSRAGLELALLVSILLGFIFQFVSLEFSHYRGDKLVELRTEILARVNAAAPGTSKVSIEDISDPESGNIDITFENKIGKIDDFSHQIYEVTFEDIPTQYRILETFKYSLYCPNNTNLISCWSLFETQPISFEFDFYLTLVFSLALFGIYARTFLGTHFIDEDPSFLKAVAAAEMSKSLRKESLIRPILYGSGIAFWSLLLLGESAILGIFLIFHSGLFLYYLHIYKKALDLNTDPKESWTIKVTDGVQIFMALCFSIQLLLVEFTSINLSYSVLRNFFFILMISFIVVMAVEFFVIHRKILTAIYKSWWKYSRTVEYPGKNRQILFWKLTQVDIIPVDEDEASANSESTQLNAPQAKIYMNDIL